MWRKTTAKKISMWRDDIDSEKEEEKNRKKFNEIKIGRMFKCIMLLVYGHASMLNRETNLIHFFCRLD